MGQQNRDADPSASDWRSVVALFEANVAAVPDAVAVEGDRGSFTYAELAARVDRFAARLAHRLGEERLVGLCLRRDADLPAWLLAILKVGGAYLPIDPALPPARLAQMMEDARPALIVADDMRAEALAATGIPILVAEADEPAAPLPPLPPIGPDTLAYVIFTSGSTGRPKGVEIEHGSLAALMRTMTARPGFARGDSLLAFTRLSFDLSVPDMFLPLTAGGSLVMVGEEAAADPERLARAFARHLPRFAAGTPSMWRALLEAGWTGHPSLRIVAGGEAVTRGLADRLLPCGAEVWNIYGPTEATVWATACRVEPGDGPVPIGWPLDGVSAAVVGPDGCGVAPGTVGEIAIGGIGVARGYRNRPALTAERFVTRADGTRCYLTGDLGRVDDRGALFCLGRTDDQVKVRGFRIELGDVEAALARHPGVAWCAAKVHVRADGEATLTGYVVPRRGSTVAVADLRAFLHAALPPYMVPDRLVPLPVMPLTANGKVDRAALPDPAAADDAQGDAPSGATEQALATIWRELLGTGDVARGDDFFECGGYSLMTVRLARGIEAAFGLRLALVDLMQHSTLADMAARIDRGHVPAGLEAPLLTAPGVRPPLFWLDGGPLMRSLLRHLPAGQPAHALNASPADERALSGTLSIHAVARRLKARLRFNQPHGPYRLGGWCRWGIVAFELAQQLVDEGETVALLVLLDADPHPAPLPLRQSLRGLIRDAFSPLGEPKSLSQRVERATRRYTPGHYTGDVLLLRPERAGDGGWGGLVEGDLTIASVPGDHVSMVRGSSAALLAAEIGRALERVDGGAAAACPVQAALAT